MDSCREKSRAEPPIAGEPAKTTDTNKMVDSEKVNPAAAILGIPAELRNRIYEEHLVEEEPITVDRALKQPSLLRTCRQMIRSEAVKIWYLRNQFDVEVLDCNGDLCRRFYRFSMHYGDDENGWPLLGITSGGTAHWPSLLRWCEEVHKEENFDLDPHVPGQNALIATVTAAHSMAAGFRGRPWGDCKVALETIRQLASWSDTKWLED